MAISPMMQHYLKTKEQNKDAILFYRLGDFYEMFFEDAITCSKVLDLTLTGKDCGLDTRAPMCGIPYHALDNYLGKMLTAGYKVAICEQVTIPGEKPGLVEREVVKIITPGTVTETSVLDERKNNYISSVVKVGDHIGVCYCDITTGLLEVVEFNNENSLKLLDDTLIRVRPSEVICNEEMMLASSSISSITTGVVPKFTKYYEWAFSIERAIKNCHSQFKVSSFKVFDAENLKEGLCAIGALLEYLAETQKRSLSNINKIKVVKNNEFLHLDINTRRNLELVESMNTKKKQGSLLYVLDNTRTSMGARKLRSFIEQPLQVSSKINERLDAVEELVSNIVLRENLIQLLQKVNDIERISGKISYGSVSPRDCLSLYNSLMIVPLIKSNLFDVKSALLKKCYDDLIVLEEVTSLIENAISEDAPALLKDGKYIRDGYNAELDDLRQAGKHGQRWLSEFEIAEKQKTGIKNLKVGFNKIFGYYIEVSNSWIESVPYTYIRKQTTTTGERYITPELKEMENKLIGSEENAKKLEQELFSEVKNCLLSYVPDIQLIAGSIAMCDALTSLAVCAVTHSYTKPVINDNVKVIKIIDGRHPVIESFNSLHEFVPNDTLLDGESNRTMVITGPNMAGKSTYMRQVAVITLMAHIGSFVPAKSAEICLVDRIFTRVGASDDLAFGQSTFMVEMTEVANILNNATSKSLLILDEVGRGTSTYDGLSIAWAVMEYLSKHLKAKTLFATHYHELTDLEGITDGVKNYRVQVKEFNNSVIFLHKIARGSANKSFGIEVAALAGLPDELITRAKELLTLQEVNSKRVDLTQKQIETVKASTTANIAEIIAILKELDMNTVSPIVAFGTLQNLVDKVKKEN
ncbi:MAG: DNA mismatch repair protein MutS [Clostridia bacterium]